MKALSALISIGMVCFLLAFALEMALALLSGGQLVLNHLLGTTILLFVFFMIVLIMASIWKGVYK